MLLWHRRDGKAKSINEVGALLALYLAYGISNSARDLRCLEITDIKTGFSP